MEEKQKKEKLNIYQKMDLVRVDVGIVSKNIEIKTGSTSGYKAVSEVDVLKAVNEAEHKYGLVSFQERIDIIEQEKLQTQNGLRFYIRVKSIVKVVNIENPLEFVYFEGLGDGIDTQDKTCGKAVTYAMKYALMKGYKIPSGEDPDYFRSEQIFATDEEVEELTDLIGEDKVERACKKYGISSLSELTQKEIKEKIKKYKKNEDVRNAE